MITFTVIATDHSPFWESPVCLRLPLEIFQGWTFKEAMEKASSFKDKMKERFPKTSFEVEFV
jgi:hypothetical protein